MDSQRTAQALEIAKQAAKEAGHALGPHFGKVRVATKGGEGASMGAFSQLDGKIETLLRERLAQFARDTGLTIGFCGEEQGARGSKKLTWLVDPIDGRTHLARGLPMCTAMIALVG